MPRIKRTEYVTEVREFFIDVPDNATEEQIREIAYATEPRLVSGELLDVLMTDENDCLFEPQEESV
jgi:hypothetical protein